MIRWHWSLVDPEMLQTGSVMRITMSDPNELRGSARGAGRGARPRHAER